ncbi:hypothetical protein KKB18_07805, partial [bacterium]|nr:hypothetical protein [bacterium]
MIRRRITPDAHSKANAATTPPIICLHLEAEVSEDPEAAIITPATIMAINDASRMTVTSILVNQSIRRGNASSSEMIKVSLSTTPGILSCFALDTKVIHFPIKGTLVKSSIPQHLSNLFATLGLHSHLPSKQYSRASHTDGHTTADQA